MSGKWQVKQSKLDWLLMCQMSLSSVASEPSGAQWSLVVSKARVAMRPKWFVVVLPLRQPSRCELVRHRVGQQPANVSKSRARVAERAGTESMGHHSRPNIWRLGLAKSTSVRTSSCNVSQSVTHVATHAWVTRTQARANGEAQDEGRHIESTDNCE